jgi:hypothetical protein
MARKAMDRLGRRRRWSPSDSPQPMGRLVLFEDKGASGPRRMSVTLLVGVWLCLHVIMAPILLPLRAFYPSELDVIKWVSSPSPSREWVREKCCPRRSSGSGRA